MFLGRPSEFFSSSHAPLCLLLCCSLPLLLGLFLPYPGIEEQTYFLIGPCSAWKALGSSGSQGWGHLLLKGFPNPKGSWSSDSGPWENQRLSSVQDGLYSVFAQPLNGPRECGKFSLTMGPSDLVISSILYGAQCGEFGSNHWGFYPWHDLITDSWTVTWTSKLMGIK